MGGHSKKAGRGGGGSNRNRHDVEGRKKLSKDPGVPDLKHVSDRLMRSKAARRHLGIPALSGGKGKASPTLPSWASRPLVNMLGGAPEEPSDCGDASDENQQREWEAARRREMTVLALQASKKVHEYQEPLAEPAAAGDHEDAGFFAGNEDKGAEKSLRRFYKEFRRVVEACDVLLQVLDVRDPLGCRLSHLERTIRSDYGDKKTIVIVLNKIDLVPSKEVVDAWIQYFQDQEGLLCVPFVAAAKGNSANPYVANLFKTLRLLARGGNEDGARKSILVGVIGYPNVGKSSVINTLKRKSVVGVGNMPGVTTGNTEVELRADIRVMDCPGVVMPGEDTGDVVLRNAVKVSDLTNPFAPVERLLQRCATEDVVPTPHLCRGQGAKEEEDDDASERRKRVRSVHPLAQVYEVGSFDPGNAMEFIRLVGIRRGRLRQGGEVDEELTARMILSDWNDGRIAYYTLPPAAQPWNLDQTIRAGDRGGGSSAELSSDPVMLTKLTQGLTLDHLPTFHLSLRHCKMIGGGKKKKWRHDQVVKDQVNDGDVTQESDTLSNIEENASSESEDDSDGDDIGGKRDVLPAMLKRRRR